MTGSAADDAALRAAIDEALALLRDSGARGTDLPAAALPSLLDQARALLDRAAATPPEPVRLLHHFACTGGTLIAKCLAALPNTLLLSEIDPLSRLGVNPHNPHFAPSDLILHLHYSLRGVEDEDIVAVFLGGLAALLDRCDRVGRRLVLRDHTHSQFCHGPQIPDRPTLAAIVGRLRPVRSVLTVREPMESYLSLLANGWDHFQPTGPAEYARRYHAFLDAHADVPLLRYESFVEDPEAGLATLCTALALPFDAQAIDMTGLVRLSGDSGRSGAQIAPRPPRPVPPDIAAAAAASPGFAALRHRLGYD